ncbi:11197_t:CDS:1, partial [Entrophospora sp. SA101]
MDYRINQYAISNFLQTNPENQPEQSSDDISFPSTYSNRSEINCDLENAPPKCNRSYELPSLTPLTFEMWRPSRKLQKLSDEFKKK